LPLGHLFVSKSGIQNRRLLQRVANELQADGQALAVESARDGKAATGAEVERQGKNIGQVHAERVVYARADFEGGSRAIRVFSV